MCLQWKVLIFCFILFVGVVAGPFPDAVQAQTVTWTGATDDDWETGTNWDAGTEPTTANPVVIDIDSGTGTSPVISAGDSAEGNGIIIGDTQDTTLTIEAGGVLNVGGGLNIVGRLTGSHGEVTVTGAGSTWLGGGNDTLHIGLSGEGDIDVTGGANLTTDTVLIGSLQGAIGSGRVDGLGSTWVTDNMTVGSSGQGGFNFFDQAAVTVTNDLNIGANATGEGVVQFNDAGTALVVGGQVIVGGSGSGQLVFSNGATMTSANAAVGYLDGSTGAVSVTGAGTTWNTTGLLVVGAQGTGILSIGSAGQLTATGGIFLGSGAASGQGSADVAARGAGSQLTSGNDLIVGGTGSADLVVEDNAALTTPGSSTVGAQTGSNGNIIVRTNASAALGNTIVGANGTGSLLVESGGTVGMGIGFIGQNAGSNGTVRVGSGGQLTATGDLGVGILGDALFVVDGGGLANVTGTTFVAGSARINGTLTGTTEIQSGGVLNGSGTVGDVLVESGGTLEPGNSIGTVNIAGNVTFDPGSTLSIEVDGAGNSDLVVATGAATINGGTVVFVPFSTLPLGTPFTFLQAASVTGTFDDVTSNSIFVTPSLVYTATTVDATLNRTASFQSAAATPNQLAVANSVEALGAGNSVWDNLLLSSSTAEAQAVMDALSGEIHPSLRSLFLERSTAVRNITYTRLQNPGTEEAEAWLKGLANFGTFADNGNAAETGHSTRGVAFGVDFPVYEGWRAGFLAGIDRSTADVDDRISSGKVNSYHLGAYGGGTVGSIVLRTGTAIAFHRVDTVRNVAFGALSERLTGSYHGMTVQGYFDAGYPMPTSVAGLEPFLAAAVVHRKTADVTEKGGDAALSVSSDNDTLGITTLGLRAIRSLESESFPSIRLDGSLGWRHVVGDVTQSASMAFAGGDDFTISGASMNRNAAVIEAGVEAELHPNIRLRLDYAGQIGADHHNNSIRGSFTLQF